VGCAKLLRLDLEYAVDLLRPGENIVHQVHIPTADVGDALSLSQRLTTFGKFGRALQHPLLKASIERTDFLPRFAQAQHERHRDRKQRDAGHKHRPQPVLLRMLPLIVSLQLVDLVLIAFFLDTPGEVEYALRYSRARP